MAMCASIETIASAPTDLTVSGGSLWLVLISCNQHDGRKIACEPECRRSSDALTRTGDDGNRFDQGGAHEEEGFSDRVDWRDREQNREILNRCGSRGASFRSQGG